MDPKRTVKARKVHVFEDDGSAPNGLDAEPGDSQQVSPDRMMFACPGCGEWGAVRALPPPKKQNAWMIESGTLAEPESLTLSPSIQCMGCCGWHGYLKAGVFESC